MKSFLLPAEKPGIHPGAFIAPGAVVVGAATLGGDASVLQVARRYRDLGM